MSLYLYHARGGRSIPAQKKTGSGRGSFSTLKPGGEPGPGAVKKACGAAWEQGRMAVVWDQEPLMLVYISTNALARAVCEKIPAGRGFRQAEAGLYAGMLLFPQVRGALPSGPVNPGFLIGIPPRAPGVLPARHGYALLCVNSRACAGASRKGSNKKRKPDDPRDCRAFKAGRRRARGRSCRGRPG